MASLTAPIPYYGSKQTIGPKIAELLPAHDHYVEPFAGSLGVLLAKKPSRMETVNDLDQDLMTFWRVLRDRPEELERVCAFTPHSRAEYQAALNADLDALPDLERARLVWVRLAQGRSGRISRSGWRHRQNPGATQTSVPGTLAANVRSIAPVAERLMDVTLECRPALEIINTYGRHPSVLLYVDPPYLGSTRAAGYRYEMRDDAQHRELAAALDACRAAVVLSGYHSPLYDEVYKHWHRSELDAHTGQSDAGSQSRTEVLWSNRPFPNATPALFDA